MSVFAGPVLLQRLLQAMEDPSTSLRVAVTYAIISLAVRFIKAQEEIITLWYGRRCYERSRGEMIMMIYEKALSRKIFGGNPAKIDALVENGTSKANGNTSSKKKWQSCLPWTKSEKKGKPEDDPASMGKVLNLIRGDAYEVAQRFWEIPDLIETPLGCIVASWLTYTLLGSSSFLAMLSILVAQAITAFLTRYQILWTQKRKIARDERLQVSTQYIEVIRHLRWYGWQSHWLKNVLEVRQHELYVRIILHLWFVLINIVNSLCILMFPVIALACFTILDHHNLSVDIIFPALQIFNMLTERLRLIPDLINTLTNAYVASSRIQSFINEADKESHDSSSDSPMELALVDCNVCWPGTEHPVLKDVNIEIVEGLNIVVGKVGTGKTAFLQALLGEMDVKSGKVVIPTQVVGYCAQTPWLQSMSIRENILFFTPYDAVRYREVMETCELLPDMVNFKHGDLSFIGENGIGLSGGQKQRVALARAIYGNSPILLLDDPLSALDFSTAESIVTKLFSGTLLKGRKTVLVTHRVDLVEHLAVQTIRVENHTAQRIENAPTVEAYTEVVSNGTVDNDTKFADEDGVPDKFIEDEFRADWGVQARVYWTWIKAGKLKLWLGLSVAIALSRFGSIARSWFLKSWGEAYDPISLHTATVFSQLSIGKEAVISTGFNITDPFKQYPPPTENVRPWILAFFYLSLALNFTLLLFRAWEIAIMYAASKLLFEQVMVRVSQATFRYYDVTPIGRLLNRLTSDMGTVDGNVIPHIERIFFSGVQWIFCVIVIASVTPVFLLFSVVLVAGFVYIFLQFLPLSQSLRRLETVSLSPLFANFGELLQGLTTVRAFRAQKSFQSRVIRVVDKFQGMDHFYWSLQAWLAYRFTNLSAASAFILTLIALYSGLSPGLTAFMLVTATDFVDATRDLCKRYGELQMEFIAVERVEELLHIDQEPPGTINPPASWPGFNSEIRFDNVSIRYAPQLDPAVKDVSLMIPSGSTTAVMGRTGSGKSTLVSSILAVVRAESGQITIDGIDVSEVDVDTLRQRVTFVAQEPVLFSGTIRHNLDPLNEFSDEDCVTVLDRVCAQQGWNLNTQIESGGKNISQGQRQLVGITRAVLRRSPIIILDEATASIDLETSLEIQRILREEMSESTVITIAHRLEAVRGADYAVIMENGTVVYRGPASDMPKRGNSGTDVEPRT
jgi:ABC-type multidrug transport system fused ATPase/permease subunit